MNSKFVLLISTVICTILFGFAKTEKEKFYGESKLVECKAEIPLYYSTKGQKDLMKAAKEYENIEIVLISKRKKGKASYKFYYLIRDKSNYGPTAYLVDSRDFRSKTPNKKSLFLNYKPKKHFFYEAECFRDKLQSDSTLTKYLTIEE